MQAHALYPADVSPDYSRPGSRLSSSGTNDDLLFDSRVASPQASGSASRSVSNTPSRANLAACFAAVQPDPPPTLDTPPESSKHGVRPMSAEDSTDQAGLSPGRTAHAGCQQAESPHQAVSPGRDHSARVVASGPKSIIDNNEDHSHQDDSSNSISSSGDNSSRGSSGKAAQGSSISYKDKLLSEAAEADARDPSASPKTSHGSPGSSAQLPVAQASPSRSSSNCKERAAGASRQACRRGGSIRTTARSNVGASQLAAAAAAEARSSQADVSPKSLSAGHNYKVPF